MNFRDFLKNNIVYLDGGMGTLLQERGLIPGEYPELWNLSHPEIIEGIHTAYYDAGSNVVSTNTFGLNSFKFSDAELEKIAEAAMKNARAAKEKTKNEKEKFIAFDIGPSGKLLRPLGDLDFEDAVKLFSRVASLAEKYGADLVIIETMNDSYETKAALLAVKESTSLPVIVTNAYGADCKLITGASPEAMSLLLEGMGADAIGANCSLGPKELREVAERLLKYASVPVVMKPNAGLPREKDGKTVFDITPEEFADEVASLTEKGVRVIGGCCGTTPEYIRLLCKKTEKLAPVPLFEKEITAVSSYTHAVEFGKSPILIGERINPTGKKRFKEALVSGDIDYILSEAVKQEEAGVHILDVNVGLPEIDESSMLTRAVTEIQAVVNLPLQIDTADPVAMESALRRYNGKALINSVSGKAESMEKIFPLVKKYGGTIIALTLDENGIPKTAEGRIKIAEKILKKAEGYGIKKKDIIFDTLVMTVSTGADAAIATLGALREIRFGMRCHTSLGISNVSYGLPNRDAINGTFFALALENGLSAAIMNPYSADMMRTYYTYKALKGLDENCLDYINNSSLFTAAELSMEKSSAENTQKQTKDISYAIEKGFKDKAAESARELLTSHAPLDVIENEIIPALNRVGVGYENKTVYLPQLLMSAEAAKAAFEVIKDSMQSSADGEKGRFVIATVEGDIHDIGKNIVKLILENYGFCVIDLGKDIKPDLIADAVIQNNAQFVGLSALMTTTLPAMEKTVKLLRDTAPDVKILVGGAVLTEDYAKKIGADKYARDAMDAVRYLESIIDI
ncbi:MAG: homocysteine methyltransferase [Ruminococcaceae bacterium]|nr:homocysteine methyltransferase [Oscillospiraceae bacterium]